MKDHELSLYITKTLYHATFYFLTKTNNNVPPSHFLKTHTSITHACYKKLRSTVTEIDEACLKIGVMTGLCHSVGEWSHVKGVEELTGEIKAVVICQFAHTSKKEDGWLYSGE